MAYQPEVVEAKKVSENENNGFFEIMVELSDHNRCRLAFQQDPKTGKPLATHIRRLHTVPCAICKKYVVPLLRAFSGADCRTGACPSPSVTKGALAGPFSLLTKVIPSQRYRMRPGGYRRCTMGKEVCRHAPSKSRLER